MKHLYILTLFITSLCYSQNTSTDNYYPVGDFENGYNSFFKVNNGTHLTATIDTDFTNPNNPNSTKSLKLVTGALTAAGSQAVFKPINFQTITDTGDYRISFWAKSASENQKMYVRFQKENENGSYYYAKSPLMTFTDTNWHKVQITKNNISAANDVQFQLFFVGSDLGGQTFYIDDLNVSRGLSDTDMELSINDKFYTGALSSNVPSANVDAAMWNSNGYGESNQVSSFVYTTETSNSGNKSLKVVTNSVTSSTKRAVMIPKDNDGLSLRFKSYAAPTVSGSSDNTTYPEIKYTFSMKVKSTVDQAEVNVNYKVGAASNFLGIQSLDQNVWTTYSGSIVVPRNQTAAEKHIPNIQMYDEATYYIDDLSLTWQEWDEATMSVPIQDYSKVAIYPNPASQFITIDGVDDNANVDIYDISGKNVKSFMIKSKSQQMDISDLVKGIYLARLNNEQTTLFIKK
jgi:hypothetical protein